MLDVHRQSKDSLAGGQSVGDSELAMKQRLALFPDTTELGGKSGGECLFIAGNDLSTLAEGHGTPLYLYDASTLNRSVSQYRQTLADSYPGETGITYAGKAFLCMALAQWIQHHDLWVDCAGIGELQAAATANIPKENIVLHGVNKSPHFLSVGISQVGTIVVDNLTELEQLVRLTERVKVQLPNLWLRFRPGMAVETHTYTQTGHDDSKFGMSREEILQAAQVCRSHKLPLEGLHFHQGSQFRDPGPIGHALERTLDLALELRFELQMEAGWALCPGGGLGVAYHEDELPHPSIEAYVRLVAEQVVAGCQQRGIPLPRLQLEPGRSLIARAGVAIYRVGAVKRTARRRWLLLDGGLADNPRLALYRARYSALPVVNPLRPPSGRAWLAGPYCESGDVLIEALPFPDARPGELVAIPVSGAYHLSMASNYNGACRPAVLWLEKGRASPIQRRETPDDLMNRDLPLPGKCTPLSSVEFAKYHGYGNDYIVMNARDLQELPSAQQIRRICDRHYGFGSDGMLLDCSESYAGDFAVRIFNPDGSEAEKSGNGLRIFSRYLWDAGRVHLEPFSIWTKGGEVTAQVHDGGQRVTIMMGQVSFDSHEIPVLGAHREVIGETMTIGGEKLTYCAVTLGNPHCVVLREAISAETARRLGPLIENLPRFPNRTNVQFMVVLDRANIQIEIWERGAGYTLASGSSSCAVAATAYRLGLCDAQVAVHAPGGCIDVTITQDFEATLTGAVTRVWRGTLSGEAFHG
jgi:diaminopimelate decarboxylase/diaminopimelate epimerase